MQITGLNLRNSCTQINEYKFEGGVTILDKTNDIAKVVFLSNEPTYGILINDKNLIVPTSNLETNIINLIFFNSIKITFEKENDFIKITEMDVDSETEFYVDLRKPIVKKFYFAYFYMPIEISLENAKLKIQDLKSDFPNFEGDMAAYNRHGVAVFGWDKIDKSYALYWARPHQEKVERIKCFFCDRYSDGGTSIGRAENDDVDFRYIFKDRQYYLNRELATKITY